jgi:pyridoxal biosynthesis lyase PdxS
MALERVPADIRAEGEYTIAFFVALFSDPSLQVVLLVWCVLK